MKELFYDFHLHSCLSPCGDQDMTPNNIINMAYLKGLDIVALTDHNSSQNCKAFMEVGKKVGMITIPGMELCTSEDIHIVCLFKTLDGALEFEKVIRKNSPQIKNRAEIFGEQLILDSDDNVIGHEENLLINASGLSVTKALKLSRDFGGTCYPAHVDKMSNSIIAVLGVIPNECKFNTIELSKRCINEQRDKFLKENPSCSDKTIISSSDAHYLEDINEKINSLKLPDDSVETVINYLDGCYS